MKQELSMGKKGSWLFPDRPSRGERQFERDLNDLIRDTRAGYRATKATYGAIKKGPLGRAVGKRLEPHRIRKAKEDVFQDTLRTKRMSSPSKLDYFRLR